MNHYKKNNKIGRRFSSSSAKKGIELFDDISLKEYSRLTATEKRLEKDLPSNQLDITPDRAIFSNVKLAMAAYSHQRKLSNSITAVEEPACKAGNVRPLIKRTFDTWRLYQVAAILLFFVCSVIGFQSHTTTFSGSHAGWSIYSDSVDYYPSMEILDKPLEDSMTVGELHGDR